MTFGNFILFIKINITYIPPKTMIVIFLSRFVVETKPSTSAVRHIPQTAQGPHPIAFVCVKRLPAHPALNPIISFHK
jgi:hypothetical protein